MSDIQKLVQEAIDQLVESGAETGLQAAVYRDGVLVADAVAGVADPATGRRLDSGTPIFSTSMGKGVAATVVHVLVERGVFGYDTRVAELWPEFAAHGKDSATVRHVLTHSAGVPGVPEDLKPADLSDWQKMVSFIENAEPWWEPGTKTGYHTLTFGYIVGEIVRRATGKPISQVLREEVAAPLGVAEELYFAVPESRLDAVARLEDMPGAAEMAASMPADLPMFKTAPLSVAPSAELYNDPAFLTADVPAGGTMTARAVARMYAALLGEVDGVSLISPERLREVTAPAETGQDQIFGFPASRTLGYDFGQPIKQAGGTPTAFGFAGTNGAAVSADTATGTVVAVTKTRIAMGQFAAYEKVAEIVASSTR
ncbi:serine hydrolase domain-containing protein [Streptosporangium longisporum]|uniref:serine hydrolase domain-containing protein n=1 Tax=Streptosporangium longisporum TaxID=46187 RepID=UPI0039A632BA